LNNYPHTLLGNPERRIRFYDPNNDWYYFDRNRHSFEAILYFYQSGGRFRRPEHVHLDAFLDDAEYYDLPETVLSQFRKDEGLVQETFEIDVPENFYLTKIWLLFDCPPSSLAARILALISVCVVLFSIVIFCIETLSVFGKPTGHKPIEIADPFFFSETSCVIWFTTEFFVRLISSPSKFKFMTSWLNIIDLVAICPYYLAIIAVMSKDSSSVRLTI
jgi:hypothetical protein